MALPLDLEEIQGTVLRNRPMPYFGAYLLFRIDDADAARRGIARLLPHVTSARNWDAPAEQSWINIVLTAEGLRRIGVPPEVVDGFPLPFVQGMAARRVFLGDVGDSDPSNWDWPHGGNGFHLGLFLMAQNEDARDAKLAIGHEAMRGLPGLRLLAHLNVGIPPTMREHFGYVDGLSRPFIEGEGGEPLPGQDVTKAGEFVLGYENELGHIATGPGPEIFWKNGTFISIRKIRQNVGAFRRFLRDSADTPDGQELVAAKMMGRWRSGCPLALSPDHDDPGIVADPLRRNDFRYREEDPDGRKTPVGSHIRRINPRDALDGTISDARTHRLLRRGSAYGPLLPEGLYEEDGEDRGIVLALINADPARQFEFVQSQWINDGDFVGEGSRTDPIVGRRDLADDYAYPARPVRRRFKGLPDFTVVRGGEHVFLPSLSSLRWLTELSGGIAATPRLVGT
ncbi:peroxidase [Sphingomonas sp.]|uniref:Dyp-type peroxidase n=1 Tax=Sphingomonas sp. TaxID=28214 RepID=UPI000DAFAC3C|nr:peroxidase [Sphingomonas sp.]PZU07766.1 MAG: peroxidase [Sphingomonas sp.]